MEALAEELLTQGHQVRLLVPYDPDDRLTRVLHRGAPPEQRPLPDHAIPLGRTLGMPLNGAVSNLSLFPEAVSTLSRELRSGSFDVVHIHEPNAAAAGWYATEMAGPPTVATFHTYSRSWVAGTMAANVFGARRLYSKLNARIAADPRVVAVMLDQNVQASDGIFVRFFGRPACTTTVAAALAIKTGCPIVPSHCVRRADGRYLMAYGPVVDWPVSGSRDEEVAALETATPSVVIVTSPGIPSGTGCPASSRV